MKDFGALYRAVDASTATNRKVAAIVDYLRSARADDAAWAIYFLAGGKPRQAVPGALLRAVACEAAAIPPWLFEECYAVVGDLAETIAYLTPPPMAGSTRTLASWMLERITPLRGLPPELQRQRILEDWRGLDADGRFLYVKLIGGGLRVGVSRLLVQRAIAQAFDLDVQVVAQRMMGYTDAKQLPDAARFQALVDRRRDPVRDGVQPYPFFLAHPLHDEPASLGDPHDWLVEWKFDGVRAQVLRRGTQCAIWTRGEELVTDRFPEVVALAQQLPSGTVLDGEIVAWLPGAQHPAPFALLQRRIGRKAPSARLLREAPVRLVAYDLLELHDEDLRARPLAERRERLEALAAAHGLPLSEALQGDDWPALQALRRQSRGLGVEGLMLKRRESRYGSGRTKADGVWWKWKVDPLSVDAVLIYAQSGHGRRANICTDYTFAVWNREPADAAEAAAVVAAIQARRPANPGGLQLVPFAKAYSGLSDEEFQRVDRVIRQTTVERYGPVRSVVPSLVFELGFEGLARSKRHKSGIATRFPRMLRIRDDKPLHEAETLPGLMRLLEAQPVRTAPSDAN